MNKCRKMNDCTRRKPKESHATCKTCNRITINNRFKQCNKCRNVIFTGHEIGRNNDDGDNEISSLRNKIGNSVEMDNELNRRRPELKRTKVTHRAKRMKTTEDFYH